MSLIPLETMPEREELEAKAPTSASHPRSGLNYPEFAEIARDLANQGFCACVYCCEGVVDKARETMQRNFGTTRGE